MDINRKNPTIHTYKSSGNTPYFLNNIDENDFFIDELFKFQDTSGKVLEEIIEKSQELTSDQKIYGLMHPNISFKTKTEVIFPQVNSRQITEMCNLASADFELNIPDDIAEYIFKCPVVLDITKIKMFSAFREDSVFIKDFFDNPDKIMNIIEDVRKETANVFGKNVETLEPAVVFERIASHIVNNTKLSDDLRLEAFNTGCDILYINTPPFPVINAMVDILTKTIEANSIICEDDPVIRSILHLCNNNLLSKEMMDTIINAWNKNPNSSLENFIENLKIKKTMIDNDISDNSDKFTKHCNQEITL